MSNLVGIWKLSAYTTTLDDGQKVLYPYGEDPLGYLIYTPEGYVSVHIMRANRTLPKQPGFDEEMKIEASENFGGYIGRYEIKGSTVIHYPEVCGFLRYLEAPQIRTFHFIDHRLVIEYVHPIEEYSLSVGKNGMARSQLVWERINVS